MELQDLITKLSLIDSQIEDFNKLNFLTSQKLNLQPSGKIVIEGENEIYKFYQIGEGYGRKLIGDLFEQLGVPIFLRTCVVQTFKNIQGVLMREEKIEVIEETLTRKKLIEYMEKKGFDTTLLDRFGIQFFEVRNAGYKDGELKIFDGIWNVYPTIKKDGKIRLQDLQGEVLIEEVLV